MGRVCYDDYDDHCFFFGHHHEVISMIPNSDGEQTADAAAPHDRIVRTAGAVGADFPCLCRYPVRAGNHLVWVATSS